MIEDGFNCHKYTVNVIVNKTLYSSYGSIRKYLEEDCFDLIELIELDTISLLDIKDLIMDIQHVQHVMSMHSNTLQTPKSAVKVGHQDLAYPTLICGLFIIGLSSNTDCPHRDFQDNF